MPRKPVNKHEKWLKSLSVKQLVAAAWNANANMYRGMDRDCLREAVLASARATSVLPVPGGPWKRTPRGGVTPSVAKTSG